MGSICSGDKKDDTIDSSTSRRRADTYIQDDSSTDDSDDGNETENTDSKVDEPIYSSKETLQRVMDGFEQAIYKGNDSLVAFLVDENPELNLLDMKFPSGDSCLHVAVKEKRLKLSKYLIDNGAEINEVNMKTGDTALHHACRNRDMKQVHLLFTNDADPNICNREEESALTIADGFNDNDILHYLQPNYREMMEAHKIEDNVLDIGEYMRQDTDQMKPEDLKLFQAAANDVLIISKKVAMDIDALDDFDDDMFGSSDDYDTGGEDNGIDMDVSDILNTNAIHNPTLGSQRSEEIEELNLDEDEKRHFETIRIANTNPFSQLANTKKALHTMQNIAAKKRKLPHLNAWMLKKKSTPPYSWQKRWVIVSEQHILWSDTQKEIKDATNILERKRFNGSLHLMMIEDIKVMSSKNNRKFVIRVKEQKKKKFKTYLWKAASEEDRDYWIKGLRLHKAHVKYMLNFLGTK